MKIPIHGDSHGRGWVGNEIGEREKRWEIGKGDARLGNAM